MYQLEYVIEYKFRSIYIDFDEFMCGYERRTVENFKKIYLNRSL